LVVENDVLNDIALLAQMKRQNLESMAEAGTAVAQRATLQDFKSCSLFLSEEVWKTLTAGTAHSALHRADVLVNYLVETLGLRHPSEPTNAVITALVACCSGENSMQLQTLLQTVKSVLRTRTTRARISGLPLPAGAYIEVLPNQVDELPSNIRVAVAPQGFAAIPDGVDLATVLQTARLIPLRSTHREVQMQRQLQQGVPAMLGMPAMDPRAAGWQMLQTVHMAQTALSLANSFAMAGCPRVPEGELNNLQIFPSGNRQREAQAPSSSVRALMDRAEATVETPAVPPAGSTPAIAAEAPAPLPRPVADRPATEEDVADGATTGAEPGPDTALAGSNPLMPTHVSEAMERLAKTYYGKELPQSEETAVPGTACKRPAAAKGHPRKRPAAAMPSASAEAVDCSKPAAAADKAALMRRPAASCHSDKQRGPMKVMKTVVAAVKKKPAASSAAAAKTRCITRKQQLKWRPEGCARCRRTPGCCPSCWVKRGYEVA